MLDGRLGEFRSESFSAFNVGHTRKRVPTFLELPQAELYPVTRAPFMAVRRWCGAGSAQKAKGLLRGIVKNSQIA